MEWVDRMNAVIDYVEVHLAMKYLPMRSAALSQVLIRYSSGLLCRLPVFLCIFQAKGAISEGVLKNTWNRIYGEFLPQSEYRQSDLPTIERYIEWDEKTDKCKVEIMIPIEN